jgi:tRNA threonylcarbamoyladenosine biosynthesis protein TsaB
MTILCIETSSTNCSVALASDVLATRATSSHKCCVDLLEDQSDQYSHGERLHVFIDELLNNNQLKPSDLDAIAISAGPGSYTGLRIGVATAKGLCYSLNIPLISIDTLESLSLQNTIDSDYTIAFLDARRMEVYASVFNKKECLLAPTAVILDPSSFEAYLKDKSATIIGTGVAKFQELTTYPNHDFITVNPTAATMCNLALEKMKIGDLVKDIAYFEPFYLKEFRV